jgi:hypothetical protein
MLKTETHTLKKPNPQFKNFSQGHTLLALK